MKKIKRFVIWICKRFNRDEILSIVEELLNVLEGKNPDVKPKDDFKDKHPNYRDFSVDPLAPIDAARIIKPIAQLDYRSLLDSYEARYGKPLEPIHLRNPINRVPEHTQCPYCSAPHDYLYFNDGKKRSQLKCKLCNNLFQLHKRFRNKVVYFCPYCFKALYKWKERKEVTIYKCGNPKCHCRTAKPAITTMIEVMRTAPKGKNITLITDGNPSYQAGIHFINQKMKTVKAVLKNVIGLQNNDAQSEKYRPYKQMIERLNRTYKYHIQAQNGFACINGAIAKLVLFVTHYNFLRPHKALNYKTPIRLPELDGFDLIQNKWVKIISMAA